MRALLLPALLLLAAAPSARPAEQAYGAAPLQRLDFYPPATRAGPAPLVLFVHGGAWSRGDKGNATGAAKVAHFTAGGWAVASANYRLAPAATIEQQAQDVADAIAWCVGHAAALGIDPARIVLMGHSAGAQLAALVATDPRYLAHAGVGMDRLAGVVLLDGAAYDLTGATATEPMLAGTYDQLFGTDPARRRALSAVAQAAAPNARRFLILHVDRPASPAQAAALAHALTAAGAQVELHDVGGRGLAGHMQINRDLGEASYAPTAIVDAWLRGLGR